MTNKKILKDAIADVKMLQKTALANAKLTLAEAFTPQIQSILSSQLHEEDDEEEIEDTPEVDETPEETPAEEVETETDTEEVETTEEAPEEEEVTEEEDMEDDDMDDDFDLDEILRELDAEDEDMTESEDEEYEDDMDESDEADEIPLEDLMEDEDEMEDDVTEDEEIDLDALVNELLGEEEEEESEPAPVEEVKSLKRQLAESKKVINQMRNKMNEVNILNAKLLFANKIFKAHNLSESQKLKVIESLDRAKSIREVKLVYGTLSESLVNTAKPVKKKVNLNESASRTVKTTKPVSQTSLITESNELAARFKKLANLK